MYLPLQLDTYHKCHFTNMSDQPLWLNMPWIQGNSVPCDRLHNPNPTAYPNLALPVYPNSGRAGAHNLLKYRKVTRPGIEPRTFWTYTRCSNHWAIRPYQSHLHSLWYPIPWSLNYFLQDSHYIDYLNKITNTDKHQMTKASLVLDYSIYNQIT